MPKIQQTLVLLKPDAVQRGLIGPITTRFEQTGVKIVGMKLMWMDEALARKHYGVHEGKSFFPGLVQFITSSPIVAMVLEGPDAVEKVRGIMGATSPAKAAPGTIRGDLGVDIGRNLVHGSDSGDNAVKEIALFFKSEELHSYVRGNYGWIVE